MSNGERYDRNAFTCAHRTLPFGTRLKITNPRNGKSVIVRVTDRGPFVRGRVVDLSYAAARELGTLASGVAYVKVELVRKETEIPFPSESNVTLEMPEIEYGTAGVCYEFIPEWEKVEEDKPKEIERKVDTRLNNKKNLQQDKVEKENITETRKQVQTSAPANQQVTKTKNQATARTTPAATNRQQTAQQNKSTTQSTTSKNNSSSSWTNFFKRVKDGVTGLFE
jgi:rare lipoprotein A